MKWCLVTHWSGVLSDWVTEWLSVWVSEWLSDWVTEWLSDWVTKWLSHWVTEWLNLWGNDWASDWVTEWLSDSVTQWLSNSVTQWLSDSVLSEGATGESIRRSADLTRGNMWEILVRESLLECPCVKCLNVKSSARVNLCSCWLSFLV